MTIVVSDSRNTDQIELIRSSLSAIATQSAEGSIDYQLPVHTSDAPDIDSLRSSVRRFKVLYGAVPKGAKLSYMSAIPDTVEAIHDAFRSTLLAP